MKRLLRSVRSNEEGYILLVSLIILAFSCIMTIPVLKFMGTGFEANKNQTWHTQEIYAAEAGVYDSVWRVIVIDPEVPRGMWDPPLEYAIDGGVNDKEVNITVTRNNSFNFNLNSVATDPRTGHQSTVETDMAILGVSGLNLEEFSKFAVTSNGTIGATFYNTKITGNIWIPDINNYEGKPPDGEIIEAPITGWPTQEMLETYYSYLVNMSDPYSESEIDISDPVLCGPLYATGSGSGNYALTGTGTLTGALYIDGNLYFDEACEVSLDGNTIFATGSISTHPNSYVAGPGAILAIGDVAFSPQVAPSYLLVMSVTGAIDFQPGGNFIGAVSGNVDITMRPNSSITWRSPGVGNLDLPGIYNHIKSIDTWSIK